MRGERGSGGWIGSHPTSDVRLEEETVTTWRQQNCFMYISLWVKYNCCTSQIIPHKSVLNTWTWVGFTGPCPDFSFKTQYNRRRNTHDTVKVTHQSKTENMSDREKSSDSTVLPRDLTRSSLRVLSTLTVTETDSSAKVSKSLTGF